tara:strand:+ start:5 stop:178 length:174 start_codon:yes stop_codon:yes gene_type:complete
MKNGKLLGLSLIISSLALLYLLFANTYRGSFILSDWIVVAVDLSATIVIDLVVLYDK